MWRISASKKEEWVEMLEILPSGGHINQGKMLKMKWSEDLEDISWTATHWSRGLEWTASNNNNNNNNNNI